MESTGRLVQLAQAGNLEAFGELVERYEHAAIAVALPIVGDFHHAQDIAQECFVSAYKSLESLRSSKAFGPWLLTRVRRRSLRFASGKTPVKLALGLERVMETTDLSTACQGGVDAAGETGWTEALLEILPYLSELPEHELEVVNLRYFADLSMAEISKSLSRPVGTVTKQLSRAIQRLQQMIREPQS